MDSTARGARTAAPQRHPAAAPPRHRAAAPPRRRAAAPPRRRAASPPVVPPVVPPVAPLIISLPRSHRAMRSAAQHPASHTSPRCPLVARGPSLPHSLPPAFVAGVGQRPLRFIKRGARWCAARQLSRKRRRQQIVWQGADTRGLWPLGRRRAGHDGRELRHAQWPRDQLAGRGKHAERVGLLAAAELATYDSRRPLLRTAAAWP